MPAPFDPRLAGPLDRWSAAFAPDAAVKHDGLVKVRLDHAAFGSVLMPELLFARRGARRFYQPSFFGPPMLGFNIEPGLHVASFTVDVAAPRGIDPERLVVTIKSDGRERGYADGAQLYRCTIVGDRHLVRHAAGRASPRADGDFDLSLFHITNPAAFAAIAKSGELWSSSWNLQGTRRLANVAYAYLTSMPSIRTEHDLRRIAMSSGGTISMQTTSARIREETLELAVYRESTVFRTATLPARFASNLLAPPHLLIHRPVGDMGYYEVVGPEVYRVGVGPGVALELSAGAVSVDPSSQKWFDYVVVGDAATTTGLAAPYDEEETKEVMHLETLDRGVDLFEFWQTNRNSDQVSSRRPEPRRFEP